MFNLWEFLLYKSFFFLYVSYVFCESFYYFRYRYLVTPLPLCGSVTTL